MKLVLVTVIQFLCCNEIHNLVPRACCFFDMKKGVPSSLLESQETLRTRFLNTNKLIVHMLMVSQNDKWFCYKFHMRSILLPQASWQHHRRVTYRWNTSTWKWHTNDIQVHTSDIQVHMSDKRVTYKYIRVDTDDIRMTYEYIQLTCEWNRHHTYR